LTAGSTRLTKSFEVLKASLPSTLLMPFFAIATPRGLAGDLRRIKARLEASDAAT
jgi:hypothetical protein